MGSKILAPIFFVKTQTEITVLALGILKRRLKK